MLRKLLISLFLNGHTKGFHRKTANLTLLGKELKVTIPTINYNLALTVYNRILVSRTSPNLSSISKMIWALLTLKLFVFAVDFCHDKTGRRNRTTYKRWQIDELERAFAVNPYPTSVFKKTLALRLGLRDSRVQVIGFHKGYSFKVRYWAYGLQGHMKVLLNNFNLNGPIVSPSHLAQHNTQCHWCESTSRFMHSLGLES